MTPAHQVHPAGGREVRVERTKVVVMTITQLLIDLSVLAGVLFFAALAIVPLWLEAEAEREEGPARTARPARRPLLPQASMTEKVAAA